MTTPIATGPSAKPSRHASRSLPSTRKHQEPRQFPRCSCQRSSEVPRRGHVERSCRPIHGGLHPKRRLPERQPPKLVRWHHAMKFAASVHRVSVRNASARDRPECDASPEPQFRNIPRSSGPQGGEIHALGRRPRGQVLWVAACAPSVHRQDSGWRYPSIGNRRPETEYLI